jgi:SMI1 / KNR4 family (SUKH-1)
MDTLYAGLLDRIPEKCQRDGWYGGDLGAPRWLQVQPDHPQRADFAYPPASEEQLAATEAALGFLLPPLLRALYKEIANGGFGPGVGIQGAIGGYGSSIDEQVSTIVVDYEFHLQVGYANMEGRQPARLVDLANYAWEPQRDKNMEYLLLPYEVWPEQLLSFEDLGCCQEACIDSKTGYILRTAPTANDEEYILLRLAPSLQVYLEHWLQGKVLP